MTRRLIKSHHFRIIEPIRKYCQRTNSENIQFYEASCVDVNPEQNTVTCSVKHPMTEKSFDLPYDHLIVAVGAINNTFGIKGVEENCNFLKSLPDAIAIKKRIIDTFELASLASTSEEEKKKLLNFIVVGGGPAGSEFAAELRDMIDHDLKRWYPSVAGYAKVSIIELLDHILNTFNKNISEYVEKQFSTRDINVRVNSRVVGVEKNFITIVNKDNVKEDVPYGLAVWTTGIGTSPLVTKLREKIPLQTNRRALLTDGHLRVKGSNNIWAVGDCSTIEQELMLSKMEDIFNLADVNGDGLLDITEFHNMISTHSKKYAQLEVLGDKVTELFEKVDKDKKRALSKEEFHELLKIVDTKVTSLPPTAQVASQGGKYLGRLFNRLAYMDQMANFKYKHLFSIAHIGDSKAVIDAGNYSVSGLGAWWLWKSVYLSKQYSFHNKLSIAGNWINTSIFGRKITRE